MLHQPHQSRSRAENMKTSSRQTEKAKKIFLSSFYFREGFPPMNQAELFTLIQKVNRESYSTIPGLVVLCFFFFFLETQIRR